MSKKQPTPSETQALQILWERGRATVPELYDEICKSGEVGYTTVLKRLQRMEEKGLVKKADKVGRAHSYIAIRQPGSVRAGLLNRLMATAFDNSPNTLIQHAIGELDLSSGDIDEIRSLLDAVEKANPKSKKSS